jgi:hypothetical protein
MKNALKEEKEHLKTRDKKTREASETLLLEGLYDEMLRRESNPKMIGLILPPSMFMRTIIPSLFPSIEI